MTQITDNAAENADTPTMTMQLNIRGLDNVQAPDNVHALANNTKITDEIQSSEKERCSDECANTEKAQRAKLKCAEEAQRARLNCVSTQLHPCPPTKYIRLIP
jgi:hypothetical protein